MARFHNYTKSALLLLRRLYEDTREILVLQDNSGTGYFLRGTTVTGGAITETLQIDVNGNITIGTWQGTTVAIAYGGTGATTASGARTNLGLGTMATQNAGSVAITGGTITGASLSGSTIPNTNVTGLGTMSTQNASSVTITGGSITGTTITGNITGSATGNLKWVTYPTSMTAAGTANDIAYNPATKRLAVCYGTNQWMEFTPSSTAP